MDSNESEIWGGFFVEYTRRDLGLWYQVQNDNAAGFVTEPSGERSQ